MDHRLFEEISLPSSLTDKVPVSLALDYGAEAVRTARRFLRSTLDGTDASSYADDAELVVAELVTNAVLHAGPPVSLRLWLGADGVRIEVADGSERPPVRPVPNAEAMTGRGLALVTALTRQWGYRVAEGKVIWAEIGTGESDPTAELDIDALIDAWADDFQDPAQQTFTVSLGDVPTELLLAAKGHVDNLIREFSLATSGAQTGVSTPIPPHLGELIEVVMTKFAGPRQAIKRQALAAAARGEERTFLTMTLPATAANAGREYLYALDELEEYARAARLLTLESPPQHKAFRRWYVNALIDQLSALSVGREPPPPPSFEQHLLTELGAVAAAQRASERAARLQIVTAALAGATTPEDVAEVVVSEGVAALEASGGGLLMPADDTHIAVPGAVGYAEEIVEQMRAEGRDADLPAAHVLRTGEPVWLETQQERDQHFPSLRGFEPSTVAMCAVPMSVGRSTIGALRFSFDRTRLFDDDERRFILALAAQAALALERALLFAAERTAVERSAFLADATQRLASSLDPGHTIQTLAALLVPELADWALVYLVEQSGQAVPVAFLHRDSEISVRYAETMLSRDAGLAERQSLKQVLETGSTARYAEIPEPFRDTALRNDPEMTELMAAIQPVSGLCVPLSVRGEVIGVVGLARTSAQSYDDRDEQMVEDLAARAAVAVANAQSYQRERETALTLQRSLLPQRLPDVPGVSFAWRYLPAGASSSIGGDWYDVLVLDADRIALVIGDVMGRGVGAAAVMGQLRATARAYASAEMTPADVLTRMDSAVTRLEQAQITTAAVAVLDIPRHTLTIASAGHLPPLMLEPKHAPRFLDVEPGPPLGAATPDYPETTVTLPPGAMLLLFTDGLVEERERPVDAGMESLRTATAGAVDPEDLCERALTVTGHDAQHEDDTAMLAFALSR
ncbi:MAG: SpoIIE family protein phosphatase [Actinomycetes bacterium]